jgi:Plasmid encoded RepA protein
MEELSEALCKAPYSKQHMRLLDAATAIRLDPEQADVAFMARQLVQATLPHKKPDDDLPVWTRTNGKLTLGIRAGWNYRNNKTYGYPYGTIPRLLLFWIITEAVRTKTQRIYLGNSLAQFMRELGLDPSRGGKRSDATRLREQMQRLFHATISFYQSHDTPNTKGEAWLDMQIAPQGMLWWDVKNPEQPTLEGSWIELGKQFFDAIIASPVPVDMRALKVLKNSALALDLYAWATYTAYQTQKTGQSRSLSWDLLHKQFGAEYTEVRNFQTKAWESFRKVKAVYPNLNIEKHRGGVTITPSKPAVKIQPRKAKNVDKR